MLKRCGNLPRVGVGFLGLALVFMFSLTAHAESLRRATIQSSGTGMMAGVPAGANPAAVTPGDPPSVQQFSSAGSGNVNFSGPASDCIAAGLVCNVGQTCQCLEVDGNATDGLGPLYHWTASLLRNIVITFPNAQYPNGNNVGEVCFFATGVLSITSTGQSTISFDTSGTACNGSILGSLLYTGGFNIGPSTGGFSSAVGSGNLSVGADFFSDVGIFDVIGAGTGLN